MYPVVKIFLDGYSVIQELMKLKPEIFKVRPGMLGWWDFFRSLDLISGFKD